MSDVTEGTIDVEMQKEQVADEIYGKAKLLG